ncbi:MAG: Hsp20/alpha crystallin family protein [Alphaproteobacteria bacterium]|nr:Hsp20/alpha crystallin family protein [Alphaproteobacteria bacterium]
MTWLTPFTTRNTPANRAADPFDALQRRVNSVFDDMWGGGFGLPAFKDTVVAFGHVPSLDVTETDKAYVVSAELPGMDEKDVEVILDKDRLTIKGEKKQESEKKEADFHVTERSYGAFQRAVLLPPTADTDKAAATFAKGVLTVTVPKKPEAQVQAKKIEVKAA